MFQHEIQEMRESREKKIKKILTLYIIDSVIDKDYAGTLIVTRYRNYSDPYHYNTRRRHNDIILSLQVCVFSCWLPGHVGREEQINN